MSTPAWPAYALVMLATGVCIPIMAALNGTLGLRLGSPATAAAILLGLGFVVAACVAFASGGPARAIVGAAPGMYYLGGFAVVFYILSITAIGPRFGIANAVFFVLLGQIAAAATIDHLGLFSAPVVPLTMRRVIGIMLMAVGVFLARRPLPV